MFSLFDIAKFFHLVAFAAFAGSAMAQQRMMAASGRAGVDPATGRAYEKAAAAVVTRGELPAILLSVVSGLVMIWPLMQVGALTPAFHAKMTLVGLLAVLAHVEMFSSRRIVRLRAAGGAEADARIAAVRRRHGLYGVLDLVLVLSIVWTAVMYL